MPSWFMFAAGNAPLISMGSLDIVIIAIYFAVVLGIGIYLKKFVSTGEDFFMAGRNWLRARWRWDLSIKPFHEPREEEMLLGIRSSERSEGSWVRAA